MVELDGFEQVRIFYFGCASHMYLSCFLVLILRSLRIRIMIKPVVKNGG